MVLFSHLCHQPIYKIIQTGPHNQNNPNIERTQHIRTFIIQKYPVKMKLSPILIASFISQQASAFTPSSRSNSRGAGTFGAPQVATTKSEVSSIPSTDIVDKTLAGIDDGAQHDVFDPLSGDSPALTRNNKSEVWVPQVSTHKDGLY